MKNKISLEKSNNKRADKKLPKFVIFIIGLLALIYVPISLITISSLGSAFVGTSIYTIKTQREQRYKPGTVIGQYNEKTNTYSITGDIKNIGKKAIHDIKVEYTLYDKDNNVIGTATAYLNKLDENKTWHFTAEYTGINAKNTTYFEENLIDYN